MAIWGSKVARDSTIMMQRRRRTVVFEFYFTLELFVINIHCLVSIAKCLVASQFTTVMDGLHQILRALTHYRRSKERGPNISRVFIATMMSQMSSSHALIAEIYDRLSISQSCFMRRQVQGSIPTIGDSYFAKNNI